MKKFIGIIFRILAVAVAVAGIVISVVEEHDPVKCLLFAAGGLIAYELAVIIDKLHK